MNVFIDTNVLLDFFRMSSGDLEELRKIARLSSTKHLSLLMSDVVREEFFRNRETVIAKSLYQFKKSTLELHRPNIVRVHAESIELERLQIRFRELVKVVSDRAMDEASKQETKADQVISELFTATRTQEVKEDLIGTAMHRIALGRPPGKKESCGDAIHWEWLLHVVPNGEDLHLISRDGDFESDLCTARLATYLDEEWRTRKKSTCHLYTSLTDFLKLHFADIQLADQVDKYDAIDKLEKSPNFTTTHNVIARLTTIDDYTQDELRRLINAYQTNNQIRWVLGDEDVNQFAHKLVSMAYENDLIDEIFPIEELLNDLELEEML